MLATAMSLALTLLLSAPFQQPKTVSVSISGARMELAAEELSKTFGELVTIGNSLKECPVVIRAKDVTPSELRDKIAQALNGTWEKNASGWVLSQTAIQKRTEENFSRAEKLKRIQKALDKKRKTVQQLAPFSDSEARILRKDIENLSQAQLKNDGTDGSFWKRIQQVDGKGPIGRFKDQFALRIPAEYYLAVSDEFPRVVYSTNPTKMQQRLNIKVGDLYSQLVNDQQVWADASAGAEYTGPRSEGGGHYSMGEVARRTKPFESTAGTITLSIFGDNSNIVVQLMAFDKRKKLIFSTIIDAISYDWDDIDSSELQKEFESGVKRSKEAVLSELSQEMKKLMTSKETAQQPSKELFNRLINPEKFDPVSYIVPEYIDVMRGTKNIVSAVNFGDPFYSYQSYLSPMLMKLTSNYQEEDRWIIVRPKDLLEWRKNEPNRRTLGGLSRQIASGRTMDLEAEASMEYSLPWTQKAGSQYRQWLGLVRNDRPESRNDKNLLRIWACIPQWMKNGKQANSRNTSSDGSAEDNSTSTTFGNLPANCQLEFNRAIFFRSWGGGFQVDHEEMQKLGTDAYQKQNELYEEIYQGWGAEPTCFLGDGIPQNAPLSISLTKSRMLWVSNSDQNYNYSRSLSPNELGRNKFMKQFPAKYPWANNKWDNVDENKIRIVDEKNYRLKLSVKQYVSHTSTLTDRRFSDSKVYTLDNLPAEIKKEIDAGYKQAKEQDHFYPVQPQNSNGGTIPPL